MQEDVTGLAKDICDECLRILREPEKSQSTPAIKVFNAFLSTTRTLSCFMDHRKVLNQFMLWCTAIISHYALSHIVPHLLKLFSDPEEIANRAATLTHLSDVVSAARDTSLSESRDPILAPHKDEVLGAFTTGLKTTSSAVPSLKGLKAMVGSRGILADEELGYVVHNVDELLQGANEDDTRLVLTVSVGCLLADVLSTFSDVALDLLSTISTIAPKHVEQQTLPLLFSSLPDMAPTRDADAERQRIFLTLASLRKLCIQPALFETLVIRITSKVDVLLEKLKGEQDFEPVAAYIHALLYTLAQVLERKVERNDADVPKYVDRLLPHVYGVFVAASCDHGTNYSVASDARLVEAAAQVVGLVVQTLPTQYVTDYASKSALPVLIHVTGNSKYSTKASSPHTLKGIQRYSSLDASSSQL
jgi:DNA repair/transcription protein MET18/MMS19